MEDFDRDILTEMNLSNITPNKVVRNNKIRVDQGSIVLLFPDTNIKTWDIDFNSLFMLSNCRGIVVPNRMFTIYNKKFNSRTYYLEAKRS